LLLSIVYSSFAIIMNKQLLHNILALLLICAFTVSNAQKKTVLSNNTKPKLLVGLVIDQMRFDYLYKYANGFGNGGFKRLMREGFNCKNTNINYIPTVTGCGHACIYTGSVPAIHGIAANDWYDKKTGKMMYCTQDNEANSLGTSNKSGKQSPKNLLTTTLGDELNLFTNNRSTVVGIALKDRGAILPAGHTATAAYWMDDTLGDFITSSFYMNNLPTWVSDFNAQQISKKYLSNNWNLFLPLNKYTESTPDDNDYEGKFKGALSPKFPHITSAFTKIADIKKTPFGNSITLDFSKEVIINYNMGKNNTTDLIAISLSSTDYVGHQFAINSMELEDTYYRLDKDIENFLLFLDKQIGVGQYTLFLTADHGAAHNPKFLQDKRVPAGFLFGRKRHESIWQKCNCRYG
jgi:predicted AlkP superfamily pyrophosphatase or phosphodiesterase